MERPKADSFTAYLEAKQRLKPAAPAAPAPAASGATPLTLLFKLAEAGEMRLAELQSASGMPFEEFAAAIKDLGNSGYLTVFGAPGQEIAKVSPLGENVSRLARPVG